MVVVKSLLAGSLKVSPKGKAKRERSSTTHTLPSSSTSAAEDDSAVTSLDDESYYTSACASTAPGDSFVLAIDWKYDEENNQQLNSSFQDPYLESTGVLMKRLRDRNAETSAFPFGIPTFQIYNRTKENTAPNKHSFTKSLGAFGWPDDDGSTVVPPMPTVSMQPLFVGPTDISRIEAPDDDSSVESCGILSLVIESPDALRPKKRPAKEDVAKILRDQIKAAKPSSLYVARLFRRLGQAEQTLHNYTNAIHSLLQAASIFRRFSKRVALANVLDNVAVTYCEALRRGQGGSLKKIYAVSFFSQCLVEALEIRKEELGPWHVDTVDTLQHLGSLCLALGHPDKATSHYLEVINLRKAIFGPHHPSTAVTAHCLGNAYLQSHDTMAAGVWFEYSLNIYNELNIPDDNPAVARLLRDRERLDRVERWMDEGLSEDENLLFDI